MNTMNAIEQLKKESENLTAKIDELNKESDSLFEEHAVLVKKTSELMHQILLKTSSTENLDDTMNSLYQESDRIMEHIHANNILVREYQYIRQYLNKAIDMLEENPASICPILESLITVFTKREDENKLCVSGFTMTSSAYIRAGHEYFCVCRCIRQILYSPFQKWGVLNYGVL